MAGSPAGGQPASGAEPAGDDLAGLSPTEHPRDGPKVGDSCSGAPTSGRSGADVHLPQLLDRSRGGEVLDQTRGLHEPAIGGVGIVGHAVHDRVPPRDGALVVAGGLVGQGGLQHRGERQVQVPTGDFRVAVLVGDDLALFSEFDLAVQDAVGLGENRGVGRPAAPADGSTPAVEHPDGDPGVRRDVPDGPEGLVDFPLGGSDPAVLVGIGVADHDLLGAAPQVDDLPVGLDGEQGPQGGADGAQVVDGLKQGDETQAGRVMGKVDQSDLAGQDHGGQHVLDALGHGDDVALDDGVAVPVHERAQGAKQGQRPGVVWGAGRCQRSAAGQLGGQEISSVGVGGSDVVEVVGGEEGGQGLVVPVRMLSDVQRGEVKADHLEDPAYPRQDAVGQKLAAVLPQGPLDYLQVSVKVGRRPVAASAGVTVGAGHEPSSDGLAPDPVGL